MRAKPRYWVRALILAMFYVMAAKLGLSLALTVKQITTVWPPSGLALAALLLYGYELWPGVFVGALVANLLTNEPAGVAFGIAIGNTLEAVIGALFLQRIVRLHPKLNHAKDVVGLGIFAALVSTTVSASVGTTSLALGGLISWAKQPSSWSLWWFGDMAGVLLFAPFLLVWHSGWHELRKQNVWRLTVLLIGTAAAATLVFFGPFSFLSWSYLIFPFIIFAAFRFKQLGVTAASLVTSIIAILGTVAGRGPFGGLEKPEQQLVSLLLYIIFITVSGLFMAVAVLQREEYEQKLIDNAKDLMEARDQILSELEAKSKHQKRLESSNEIITKILDQLLDEDSRPKRGS